MRPHLLVAAVAPVVLIAAALSGCSAVSPYAAEVNDTVITRVQLDRELGNLNHSPRYVRFVQAQGTQVTGSGPGTFTQAFVATTLNQSLEFGLIHDELVRRHALPDAQAVGAALQQLPQQFADQQGTFFNEFSASYRSTWAHRVADVTALETILGTDAADQRYYDAHSGEFATEVCLRHILLAQKNTAGTIDFPASKSRADRVKAQLDAGADFANLAQADSQDNQPGGSASNGGKLTGSAADGCLTGQDLSQLVSPFVQAAATLPVGQVSAPVQTQFGYHLIEVLSRQVSPYDASLKSTVSRRVLVEFVRAALQNMKVNPEFGSVAQSDTTTGLPTIAPPKGPSLPATTATTVAAGSA